MAHLLLGDPMNPDEAHERRTAFAEERARALKKPRTKAESDRMLVRMYDARRRELQADIFSASALWWSRDKNRHFIIFVAKNRQLFQFIADRSVNGGKIDTAPFERAGMNFYINATKTLAEIDKRLDKIVAERGGPELVEAD